MGHMSCSPPVLAPSAAVPGSVKCKFKKCNIYEKNISKKYLLIAI